MGVEEYEWIEFEHEPTGQYGKLRMDYKSNQCDYFFREANPLWYMSITKEEANNKFETGEWIHINSRRLNEYLIKK